MKPNDKAEKIVEAILADVTDRHGWRQEWDRFDEDVQQEVRESWLETVAEILAEP